MSFVIDENNELIKYDDGHVCNNEFVCPDDAEIIYSDTFVNGISIKSFKAGKNLRYIRSCAFSECKNLETLDIPKGIKIDSYAFSGCEKLADKDGFIIIDNCLYGYYGHEKCVVVPDGVETIKLFKDSSIEDERYSCVEEVILPESLKEIGERAFSCCKSLRKLVVPEDVVISHSAFEGCNNLADSNGFLIINNCLFGYYGNEIRVEIPEGVEVIKTFKDSTLGNRFYSKIEELVFPASLREIEVYAIELDSLQSVIFKGEFIYTEKDTFKAGRLRNKYGNLNINGKKTECRKILYFTDDAEFFVEETDDGFEYIYNEITVDKENHDDKELDEKHINHQFVPELGLLCLLDNEEYVYPEDYIYRQDIKHVILGNIRISDEVFRGCHNLERVEFISEPGSFGIADFKDCEKLQDDNGFVIVADILYDYYGNEEHVVVPSNVKSVDVFAFMYNEKIKTVQLPEGIEELMDCSFKYCPNLEEVKIGNQIYNFKDHFGNVQRAAKVDYFGNLQGVDTRKYLLTMVIPDGVTSIRPGAFENHTFRFLLIPEGVKELKPYVFKDIDPLHKVHLPDSLEIIGEGAFEGCDSLEEINIPKNLKIVSKGAFKNTNINFKKLLEKGVITEDELEPDVRDCYVGTSVLEVPTVYYDEFDDPIDPSVIEAARHKYDGLTEYSVPEGIKYLLDAEFYNKSFVEVSLPEGLEEIKEFAFMRCKDLKRIVIPSTVKLIERCAFMGCDSLEEVIVPETTLIETSAFAHCPKLQDENGFVVVNKILFSSPSSLEGLSLPEGIIKIDENVTNRAVLELKDNPLAKKYRKAMGRYFI